MNLNLIIKVHNPFIILYTYIMLVPTGLTVFVILTGLLDVPEWFMLLNPFVFLMLGLFLKKINKNIFYEVSSIFISSLGLGMFGLMGIINIL